MESYGVTNTSTSWNSSQTTGTWEIFIKCGNPAEKDHDAQYHPDFSENGWLSSPDNLTFDPEGPLDIYRWSSQSRITRRNVCDSNNWIRSSLNSILFFMFIDAEMCGPEFTPDGKTLFLAVQHPGDSGTWDGPVTDWLDIGSGSPARPSVVAITKDDGGEIGS